MTVEGSRPDFRADDVLDKDPAAAVLMLVERSIALNASDIYLLACDGHYAASIRRMGAIEQLASLPYQYGVQLVNLIKSHCGMDLAERRRPIDGRWTLETSRGQVDFRVNTLGTFYGEDLSLRPLTNLQPLTSLSDLGFVADQQQQVRAMLSSGSGLLLVTGPTGAGKTTTLYSCLESVNDGRRKINTIEDPVEYSIKGLRQSQVVPKLDLGFAELLRGILRQSPDVIMVGEIRDRETAEIAVRAASSGLLVLSTLHSPVAAGAVQSMLSLGVPPFFLANCLLGVMAQRLIRRLADSKHSFDISNAPHTFDRVRRYLKAGEGNVIYGPDASDQDSFHGYESLTGLFEVLVMNRRLRDAVAQGRPTPELHGIALESGMLDFRSAALIKVAQGLTDVSEMSRVVPASEVEQGVFD